MKTSMCENCIKHKTIYCPNSDKCLAREDKPFYEDKYTILTKNEALNEVLKDYTKENQQLKIQISAREAVYRKLEDNWDIIKQEILKIRQATFSKYNSNEWENCLSFNDDIKSILDKMEELERGVNDEN